MIRSREGELLAVMRERGANASGSTKRLVLTLRFALSPDPIKPTVKASNTGRRCILGLYPTHSSRGDLPS